MIETKEQYEEIMRHTPFYEGGETGAVRETIEALREVAKLLHYSPKHGGSVTFNDKELGKALDALPDWLKEDG